MWEQEACKMLADVGKQHYTCGCRKVGRKRGWEGEEKALADVEE